MFRWNDYRWGVRDRRENYIVLPSAMGDTLG